jgi:hypothetical protein
MTREKGGENAMNEKLIREEAKKIENEFVRNILLSANRPEMWTPQAVWNLAKSIVELEEKVRRYES